MFQENGSPIPASILRRRLSLPPHLTLPPAQHIKGKTAPGMPLNVGARQQLLISKYLFTRKHKESNTGEDKLLRKLLQEKPKKLPTPDPGKNTTVKMMNQWTFQRRKNLFVEESGDWSSQINKVLERKMSKWKQAKVRKHEAMMLKREEKEREARETPPQPPTVSTSIHQQLPMTLFCQTASSLPLATPMTAPLINTNPYLSHLSLSANPIVYPSSTLLPSYPFFTALPYVPTLIPQVHSNLYNLPSAVTTPPCIVSAPQNFPNGKTLPSTTSVPLSPIVTSAAGQKRKPHTYSYMPPPNGATPSYQTNNTVASLLKQEPVTPPTKQPRLAAPKTAATDERSDGEESVFEGQYSPMSPRENKVPLWQFLLDLLLSNTHSDCIQWNPYMTMEFEIKKPKEVARLWKSFMCDESADYAKFRQILNYYCTKSPPTLYPSKGGRKYVYRFSHSVLYYINMKYSQQLPSAATSSPLSNSRDVSGSHEVLVVD